MSRGDLTTCLTQVLVANKAINSYSMTVASLRGAGGAEHRVTPLYGGDILIPEKPKCQVIELYTPLLAELITARWS